MTRLRTAIEDADEPTTSREAGVQLSKARAVLAILNSDANKKSEQPTPRHPVEEEVGKKSKWTTVRRIVRLGGFLSVRTF